MVTKLRYRGVNEYYELDLIIYWFIYQLYIIPLILTVIANSKGQKTICDFDKSRTNELYSFCKTTFWCAV